MSLLLAGSIPLAHLLSYHHHVPTPCIDMWCVAGALQFSLCAIFSLTRCIGDIVWAHEETEQLLGNISEIIVSDEESLQKRVAWY